MLHDFMTPNQIEFLVLLAFMIGLGSGGLFMAAFQTKYLIDQGQIVDKQKAMHSLKLFVSTAGGILTGLTVLGIIALIVKR